MAFGLTVRERLRFAILSPHLDDGILSLGASIAEAVRGGHEVTVVTVFAGNPESQAAAGSWDSRAGFATEGEATQRRREEDRRACGLLGARCVWLPYGDDQYANGRDENDVWARVAEALAAADAVLVPGRPLLHRDHRWLASLVEERGLPASHGGRYSELPYDLWSDADKRRYGSALDTADSWSAPPIRVWSRRAKWRACGAYASQLPWLGRGSSFRRALIRSRIGGERVGWRTAS